MSRPGPIPPPTPKQYTDPNKPYYAGAKRKMTSLDELECEERAYLRMIKREERKRNAVLIFRLLLIAGAVLLSTYLKK